MEARTFLKHYRYDERMVKGGYFSSEPILAEAGDTVGVVLFNLGGPDAVADIEPFLYNLFMDPAIIDLPFGGILRHWLAKFISSRRAKRVSLDYEQIGGGSPINSLTREQSVALERRLNTEFGEAAGVRFRTYIAMRYWHPTTEEAVEQMVEDEVNKVILLPLYPQYSKTTTGASQVYWWMLQKHNEIPAWPTRSVYEYAAHPKFVQAISERIDEALARFPASARSKVQLVFSAHGTPLYEMKKRRDPYCCLIHATVDRVMRYRKHDLDFHISFQSKVGPAEWLTPSTPDKLKDLAGKNHKAVLIIPVAFVTDHIETAYELNIEIRQEAMSLGIEHYEVTTGLNSHPLFIEALAAVTLSKVTLSGREDSALSASAGDNSTLKFSKKDRSCRCEQCEEITEALCWESTRVETIKPD